MSTVGDIFAAADPAAEGAADLPVGEERPRMRAHVPARARDYRSLPVVGKLLAWFQAWRADATGFWVWDGRPPTPRELWRQRTPDRERVPGRNTALRWAWIVANHAVLPLACLFAFGMWLCLQPLRLVLAAAIGVPLIVMWIS